MLLRQRGLFLCALGHSPGNLLLSDNANPCASGIIVGMTERSPTFVDPPTPEDERWAAPFEGTQVASIPGATDNVRTWDRFTVGAAILVGLSVYLLLNFAMVPEPSQILFAGLAGTIAGVERNINRKLTRMAIQILVGSLFAIVWMVTQGWVTLFMPFQPIPVIVATGAGLTLVVGPVCGLFIGLLLEATHWLGGVLRNRVLSMETSPGEFAPDSVALEGEPTTEHHDSIYSVPKRFDIATLLTVSLAYSLLFTLLKVLDSHWTVFAFIGGLTAIVALAQMLYEEPKQIRTASLLGGGLFTVVSAIVLGLTTNDPFARISLLITGLLFGPFLGYAAGVLDAGVFLIADRVRKWLE